jgi:hypothetical protein
MKRVVFDIEADQLLDKVTKIHCLCYHDIDSGENGELSDYQAIKDFVLQDNLILICHNEIGIASCRERVLR